MHLTLNSRVTDLLPAMAGLTYFMYAGNNDFFVGRCLDEHLNLERIRCEIPLASGTLERDLQFLR
jgi:hypothetical protein